MSASPDFTPTPAERRYPCVAYTLSLSTGAATCRMHAYLPPIACCCADYSPDPGATGERAERWARHLADLAALAPEATAPTARPDQDTPT